MEEGYALTFVIPHLKRHHLHELFPIEFNAALLYFHFSVFVFVYRLHEHST